MAGSMNQAEAIKHYTVAAERAREEGQWAKAAALQAFANDLLRGTVQFYSGLESYGGHRER
jgi:hypothetical protein